MDKSTQGKFITAFSDSGEGSAKSSTSVSSQEPSGSTTSESHNKGIYAFIGGIGFGIIALIFIFITPNSFEVIGLSLIGMILLGIKAILLVYPKIAVLSHTSLTVRSYFLTAIFLMAWIIYMAWVPQYLTDLPDLGNDVATIWIEMVVLSILTAVSMFFLAMTMTRR
jgi:hypothetical protein